MSWSLGSIYVELICNTGKFLTGMDKGSQAAKKTGRDIRTAFSGIGNSLAALGPAGQQLGSILEGAGNKAAAGFDVAARKGRGLGTLFSGSILGGITAVAGGLFALAIRAADVGAKIYDASEKTGISASKMSGLMAISKELGGNFDALTTSLARAGANLEKTTEAGGTTNKILFEMEQRAGGAALGAKDMGDRIQLVLAQIFKLHDAGQRNLALNQLLGKGWQENITTLRALAEQGYAPAIALAQRMHVFFDPEHAAQAKKFKAEVTVLTSTLTGLAIAIGERVIPFFIKWAEGAVFVAAKLNSLGRLVQMTVDAMMGNWKGAGEALERYNRASNDATQITTDFLVQVDALTKQAEKGNETEHDFTKGIKEHVDALAELIDRERDELAELDFGNSKMRAMEAEYDRTIREIERYVEAGGSAAEATRAQALALDILKKKFEGIPNVFPAVPWSAVAPRPNAPTLQMPPIPAPGAGLGGAGVPPLVTAQQEKSTYDAAFQTREYNVALEREINLLRDAPALFKKLADAFPGLSKEMIAANAQGQELIKWLTKVQAVGGNLTFGEAMHRNLEEIRIAGDQTGAELANMFTRSIDQIEDSFAKLVVTGKSSFKQIAEQMEESLVKMGLQKGVSWLLGKAGVGGGLLKADGSRDHPFYVKFADKAGLFGGKPTSGAGGGPSGASGGDNGPMGFLSSVGSGFKSVLSSVGSGFKGIMSDIGHAAGSTQANMGGAAISPADLAPMGDTPLTGLTDLIPGGASALGSSFGGFMQAGGEVMPGRSYMVGERHPELFVPHASGTIVPSLSVQQLHPMTLHQTYNISTPDANSFRRSQSQIVTEGVRSATMVHSRNA